MALLGLQDWSGGWTGGLDWRAGLEGWTGGLDWRVGRSLALIDINAGRTSNLLTSVNLQVVAQPLFMPFQYQIMNSMQTCNSVRFYFMKKKKKLIFCY